MKKKTLLILSFILLMFSCLKDEEPSITIDETEITVSSARSVNTISFTTNKTWTAKSSEDWCTLSQTKGDKTTKSITITAAPNMTYDDRSCFVSIMVEGITKTIKINQSQEDAIIASNKTYRLSNEGQSLEIELKTNVNFEVIIPEATKSWVSESEIDTRALTNDKVVLIIAENKDSYNSRTAEIYIKDTTTNLQETLTIIQDGSSPSTVIVGNTNPIQHLKASTDFLFQLNDLSDKEVFFVFTNGNEKNSITLPQLHSDVKNKTVATRSSSHHKPSSFVVSGKPSITEFNNAPRKQPTNGLNKPRYQKQMASQSEKLTIGSSEAMYDDRGTPHLSTVRKVISAHGKTLYIWVDNECWGPSSKKKYYVTQQMIDAFAPKFLTPGDDNDIYEWVTNAAGEPWGPTPYSDFISETNDIHIWLTDIDDDNKTDGTIVLGYYFARDNFLKSQYKDSNEKLMFTLDAVLFGKTTNGKWNVSDYWPMEFISALAHEFTHMIYFYQHNVLTDQEGNTAINEMSAQCVEDLVANKIQANGPRGVKYGTPHSGENGNEVGRLPLYNSHNDYRILEWSGKDDEVLINYSKTYALGSFLMRNYGGAKFIKELIQNKSTGSQSIVDAVNVNSGAVENYGEILQRFGAANLLSDNTSPTKGYSFNTGEWSTSTVNGINYELGSINLYNYSPPPKVYNILPTIQKPGSNILYRAGTSLNGKQEWLFQGVSPDTRITVVIK